MDNESQPLLFGMSLSDMIGTLWTYKWSILFFSSLGFFGAAYLYVKAEPVYVSEAKLLVRYLKAGISLEEVPGASAVKTPDRTGANIINSEIEILTSRSLIEEVVDNIGPSVLVDADDDAFVRSLAIVNVLGNFSVNVPRNSNIIRLKFVGEKPEVVQQVLDRMVDLYLRKHGVVHHTTGEYEFLSQQTDQIRARLAKTEEDLRRLKQEIGVTTLEDTKLALSARLEKLHDGLRDKRTLLAAALARVELVEPVQDVAEGREVVASDDAVRDLKARRRAEVLSQTLAALRAREMQLLASFSSESSPVQDLRLEIERAEQSLRAEMETMDWNLEGLSQIGELDDFASEKAESTAQNTEVAALRASVRVLLEYEKVTRAAIEALNDRESTLVQLQRQWEMLEANYRYYARSLEHARIEDALNSGRAANISIVQPASLPLRPQYLTRKRNAIIGLTTGLGFGLLLAFLRVWARSYRLSLPVEVTRALGVPTLIAFPHARAARQIGMGGGQRRPPALPPHEGELDSEAEEGCLQHQLRPYFDALCDRLLIRLNERGEEPVLLGITGCKPGAGVSTISAGLGGALSRLGAGRVLLVDTTGTPTGGDRDLDSAGLIDVMRDGEGNVAIIQPNLYMLTAREVTGEVNQVGMFQKLRDLVKTLESSSYRYVILELPPISDTSSALALARHLHGVVVVLESEKERKGEVARAAALLRDADATLLGAVLNKRKQRGWEPEKSPVVC